MNYRFLESTIEKDELILPNSDKINPFLLKNNNSEVLKAIDFINGQQDKNSLVGKVLE